VNWLPNQFEARRWGGPSISYPVVVEILQREIQWNTHRSYSLAANEKLVGFAQIAQRFGMNHVCRVVIDPDMRGLRLGWKLLSLLFDATLEEGRDYSLFVFEDNEVAVGLYRKLGFVVAEHPAEVTNMAACFFMVKSGNS